MIKLVKPELRIYPRKKLLHEVPSKVTVGSNTSSVIIINRSLGGFSLIAESELIEKAKFYQNELLLEYHNQVFKAAVKNHRNSKGKHLYGVQFTDYSEEKNLSFKDRHADWDFVENQETIQNIFSDLSFKSVNALVSIQQLSGQSTLVPHIYDKKDHSMMFQFLETSHGQVSLGKAKFTFNLFQTFHYFEGQILQINESMIKVKLPRSIARILRRETERILSDQFKTSLEVEINNPLFSKTYKGQIHDISEHGLSILDKNNGDLFLPIGYQMRNIQLKLDKGQVIEGRSEIRGAKWIEEKQCYAVGFKFNPKDSDNTTKWHNFILESRYPEMSFDYEGDRDHKKIWDLFERSGHLNINKSNKSYTHILDLTKRTWEKLSKTGTRWSKRAMIKKNDKILGHIQLDRIYQDTWCVHHLSIDSKVSKLVARDIYALTTDVLLAEGGEYLVSFTEANKPWNHRSYYDFVEKYRYKDHNELKSYTTTEVSTAISQKENQGIDCRIANQYDQKRILRYIDIYVTELEKQASCLNSENLKLEKTAQEWKKNDLLRGREFVVAYKNNQLVGLSALEYGESGLNIVGILNMLYVFNLDFAEEQSKIEAVDAMLQKSALFYKNIGRDKFLVNLEKGLDIEKIKTENSFLTEAVRWIAKKDILPRYRSFSHLLYGHIILNKEKIRKKLIEKKNIKN